MKVFISWSGSLSHRVAVVLREWLPSVLQVVEPYVSSEDIDKGARWNTDISRELEESKFGILCVVPDNLSAPWLNFEAGALSKSFDKGRVAPFLFGLQRAEVPPGPLLQFQSTLYEQDEVAKLVHSINDASGDHALDGARLEDALQVWWPHLDEKLRPLLDEADQPSSTSTAAVTRGSKDVLAEILDLVRSQQRVLASPDELLPPDYLATILRGHRRTGEKSDLSPLAFKELDRNWARLVDYVFGVEGITFALLTELMRDVEDPLVYILRGNGRRPRRQVAAALRELEADAASDEE